MEANGEDIINPADEYLAIRKQVWNYSIKITHLEVTHNEITHIEITHIDITHIEVNHLDMTHPCSYSKTFYLFATSSTRPVEV